MGDTPTSHFSGSTPSQGGGGMKGNRVLFPYISFIPKLKIEPQCFKLFCATWYNSLSMIQNFLIRFNVVFQPSHLVQRKK